MLGGVIDDAATVGRGDIYRVHDRAQRVVRRNLPGRDPRPGRVTKQARWDRRAARRWPAASIPSGRLTWAVAAVGGRKADLVVHVIELEAEHDLHAALVDAVGHASRRGELTKLTGRGRPEHLHEHREGTDGLAVGSGTGGSAPGGGGLSCGTAGADCTPTSVVTCGWAVDG